MTRDLAIRGAKGAHTPVEASDTLRSVQRAELVDLLGEGHIAGLVNGLRSIYLDGVPAQNADGSLNFKDFSYDISLGGPTDGGQHAFQEVSTEVGVGTTVLYAVPVVRSIADPTVDAVRVTISVPALMESKSNGDRVGASFEWAIEVQSAGGGFVERHRDTVSGKASSPYVRAVKINLAATGPAPWDIRVRRITADSTSSDLVNAFQWASYTALSGVRMLYKHSARVGLTFDARNFNAIPVRAYDVMGIDDWDIPVNYDPLTRATTGVWNGLFKQGWTCNPAWVLYNLVQHRRYGLGEYVTALPDKWTLYRLAAWCDAAVPDGRGGTEPRYSINTVLTQQAEALRLLQDICAVFRGALLYGGGMLGATWDAPGEPVASYVPANVVDGLFTYADGSRAAKRSSCTCWYNDRTQMGKRMPATWDDPGLISKYGVRTMEIDPIGIATPGQALRMAKWALYSTELEDNTVTFRVGADGAAGRIGDVFQVSDPSETGERLGGRVHSATLASVTLDAPVTLLAGETYALWVTMADPADPNRLVAEQRTVTTGVGTHTALAVSPAFSAAPTADTVWVLESNTAAPTLWRYIAITEVRNRDNVLEYEITGLRHEPGKFDLIELNQPLTIRPTRRLPDGAAAPTALTITETNYVDGNTERIRASVSWQFPTAGLSYQVAWRLATGPWTTMPRTTGNTVDIDGLQPGLLEVQVYAVNVLGQQSATVAASATLTGSAAAAAAVTGLAYTIVPGGLLLKWDANTSALYSKTRLSYGPAFDGSVFFWEGKGSDYTVRPPADGTYKVWAVHYEGARVSAAPASLDVNYVAMTAGADGVSSAAIRIFKRSTSGVPALPTVPATYTFATGALAGLTNGWSTVYPSGSGVVYTSQALAAAAGPTDQIQPAEWTAALVFVQDGANGISAPVVNLTASQLAFVTATNATSPTPSQITVSATPTNIPAPTYQWYVDSSSGFVLAGATGSALVLQAFPPGQRRVVQCLVSATAWDQITIYSLADGDDAIAVGIINENQTISCDSAGTPLASGSGLPLVAQVVGVRGATVLAYPEISFALTGSSGFSGMSLDAAGNITITGITADSAWATYSAQVGGVTFPAGRLTANKSRNGAKGDAGNPGTRGSVKRFIAGYSYWDSAVATAAVSSGAPLLGDEVTLYNGSSFAETRTWNGASWALPGMVVPGSMLVQGTVTAAALVANTITAASGVLANAAVQTLTIGADAVTVPVAAVEYTDYVLTTAYQTICQASFFNAAGNSSESPRTLLVQGAGLFQSGGAVTDAETVFLSLWRYYPSLGIEVQLGMGDVPVTVGGNRLQLECLPVGDTTPMLGNSTYVYRLKAKRSTAGSWAITSLGASLYIMGAKR